MSDELARYILDLEGRVTALSAIIGSLMWVLRERDIVDPTLAQQIYRSTSEAIAAIRPESEGGADRMILALQAATEAALPGRPDQPAGV